MMMSVLFVSRGLELGGHENDSTHEVAWDLAIQLMNRGIITKPTQRNVLRFAPPLCINEKQIDICLDALHSSLSDTCKQQNA